MTPSLDALSTLAGDVLRRVPDGLDRGKVSAGLYGVGFVGRCALPRLRARGVRVAAGYDANASLHGKLIDGLQIHAASALRANPPEFVIITARHAVQEASAMLSELGIPHVSYDAWQAAGAFAAFRDVHDRVLADARSKEVLRAVLAAMLTGDARHCSAVCEADQYFCLPHFRDGVDEHFVDAGAFDGDSAEAFIRAHAGRFAKLYAFEPGPAQFAALKARAARLAADWSVADGRIEVVNAGLGHDAYSTQVESANGEPTSLASTTGANGAAVNIVGLDQFLRGRPVTFLKADVEGMEIDLLKGAAATIRHRRPKLAICAYHHPTDIPDIASQIGRLVPDYRFALRHHSPRLMETVLYCWTE